MVGGAESLRAAVCLGFDNNSLLSPWEFWEHFLFPRQHSRAGKGRWTNSWGQRWALCYCCFGAGKRFLYYLLLVMYLADLFFWTDLLASVAFEGSCASGGRLIFQLNRVLNAIGHSLAFPHDLFLRVRNHNEGPRVFCLSRHWTDTEQGVQDKAGTFYWKFCLGWYITFLIED